MSTREQFANECWQEIYRAALGQDDGALWFAWRRNFPHRFWRDLGAPGVGALCQSAGLDYPTILRRITAYDMTLDRQSRAVEEQRVSDSQRPPPPHA